MYVIPQHRRARADASSPTPCRSAPIAAPAGPRRTTALERLVDAAARVDRHRPRSSCAGAISSRQAQIPYTTAVGTTLRQRRLRAGARQGAGAADYDGLRRARARSRSRPASCAASASPAFSSIAGGTPSEGRRARFPGDEHAAARALGVQSTGQGHATIYPPARRRAARHRRPSRSSTRHGDTDLDLDGMPSVASRSTMTAGSAIVKTRRAGDREGQARRRAPARGGRGRHRLSRRRISRSSAPTGASRCSSVARQARGGRDRRDARHQGDAETPQTFPNGCHIAEVEIDPDTGASTIAALHRGRRLRRRARSTCWSRARCTAASRRASARRCARTRVYDPTAASWSPARSWTTRCRAPTCCRSFDASSHNVPARPIRSASKASARPAPPARSPPS